MLKPPTVGPVYRSGLTLNSFFLKKGPTFDLELLQGIRNFARVFSATTATGAVRTHLPLALCFSAAGGGARGAATVGGPVKTFPYCQKQ